MRAVGISEAGGYGVIGLIDRVAREAATDEVRIAVRAAAVNPTDSGLRAQSDPELPPPWTPGMDAAGVIEMVGAGVDRFAVGQEVMAAVQPRRPDGGAQAELLVVPAASVVPIPDGASLEQAATLPMNGLTAMLGLQTLGLTAGQILAVSGGAGQLASYVIPLAKELGASVIADARPEDEDLVRGFGADVVVPRSEGFSEAVRKVAGDGVDALFDTALLCEAGLDAIRDGGCMVTVRGWRPDTEVRDIAVAPVRVGTVLQRTEWLEELREFASKGLLALRVAATYPPERAADAQRAMDAGGLRGRGLIVF